MLHTAPSGRHRSDTRYNPWSELSTIVKGAGQNGVKATAVLAASGGLVATFALPAQAEPSASAAAPEAAAAPAAVAAPVALAPSVVAPAVAAPVATEVVGVVGVTAVAKPKPKPRPVVVQEQADAEEVATRRSNTPASRSTARSATSTKKASTTKATSSNVPQSASGVVNIARSLLGIPYVYGGSTPAGFDCSGFTQYVFGKAGISVPRTASAQQRAATRVSNPKPGDLVFFGSPAWHVGIYTGNGKMIDSPKPGKTTSERSVFSGVSGYGRF